MSKRIADLIARLRDQPGQSFLDDCTFRVMHRDIATYCTTIARALDRAGAVSSTAVALGCPNTVTGALTLLALLQRGQTVVLTPPNTPLPAPPMCGYQVTVAGTDKPTGTGQPRSLEQPNTFLQVHKLADARTGQGRASDLAKPPSGLLIVRSSGSFASPKLIAHGHDELVQNGHGCTRALGLSAADRVLIPVPIFHMYGLGAGLIPALLAGASVTLEPSANLLRFVAAERRTMPTWVFLTPPFAATLVTRGRPAPSCRGAVVAGDRLSNPLATKIARRFGSACNLYGSSEMGVIAVQRPLVPDSLASSAPTTEAQARTDRPDETDTGAAPIGPPIEGVTLRVLAGDQTPEDHPHDSTEIGADEVPGMLWCRHPYGFRGYLDPYGALQTRARTPNGWYRTGDLARTSGCRNDGNIVVVGRADHSVNRDGRLVACAEIERAIARISGVAQAAVLAHGDGPRGRLLWAFISPSPDTISLTAESARVACRDYLPGYAIPDHIRVLPELPRLPSGKLDRRTLLHAELEPLLRQSGAAS